MDKKFKEYRDKWVSYPKDDVVTDFPLHLDIETQTMCNLRCTMCYQSFDTVKPKQMSMEMFLRIMREAQEHGLYACKLQLRNEPLLDDRIVDFIRIAKFHGILDVMMNTNATMLTEKLSQDLIRSGLDTIIFSVDGYTKEVYESIRKGSDFDKVVRNIRYFTDWKRDLGFTHPHIIIRTIKRDDIDFDEYTKFWYDYADAIVEFKCMDLKPPEDMHVYPDFCCEELWHRLSILADGSIVPCCNAAVGNKVYEPLGNINNMSIHDAWKKAEYLRDLHRQHRSDHLLMCRMCDIDKGRKQ
jgi:MoaA/NifB/PqqE/SkfB family radical SAM enzyme